MTSLNRVARTVVVSKASKKDTGLYTLNLAEVALCVAELAHKADGKRPSRVSFFGQFIVVLKTGRREYPVVCRTNRIVRGTPVSATFRYMGLNVDVAKPAAFNVSDIYSITRTA